jgi:hypothetical protein
MESDILKPKLDEAQRALQSALDEACGVDLRKVDTGELIRVEETLAVASEAAKEAVSVRLKLREKRGKDPVRAQPRDEGEQKVTHRVFDDIRGKRWHAFAVQGSAETADRASLPDSFRGGWLVFESDDELRRVAPIPENWEELDTDTLREMCFKAPGAPRRVTK